MGIIIFCGIALLALFVYFTIDTYGTYRPSDFFTTIGMFFVGALIGLALWIFAVVIFQSTCPNAGHDTEIMETYKLQEVENGKSVIYSKNYFYFIDENSIIRSTPNNCTNIIHISSGQTPYVVKNQESPHSKFIKLMFYPIKSNTYTLYVPENGIVFNYTVDF